MKRSLLVACAGLLFAALALVIHYWRRASDLEERLAARDAELKRLLSSDRVSSSSNEGIGKVTSAAPKAATPVASVDSLNPKDDEVVSQAPDILLGAGKKEVTARTEARLGLLRERLKLRPDQEAALQKAAAARNAEVLAAFERIRQNKATPPDMGVLMDWGLGNTPLAIEPFLDADQAAALSGFNATEQAGRVESMGNMELVEMQSQGSLHLTPEQKDQAFAALTGIIAEEDAAGAAYYVDDGDFMNRIDASLQRRREALQSVLDASQMQHYNRMLDEDRGQIADFFPGRK